MKQAGVFVAADMLQPSSAGVRLNCANGEVRITDGPFTESKELIAGYAMMQVPSMEEAIAWSKRFASLFSQLEIDIRPVYEAREAAH